MLYLKYFALSFTFFIIIDLLWLGFIASNIYKHFLSDFLASNVNWSAAILFYLIFNIGLVFFVIAPAIEKNSLTYLMFYGALFGLVTYSAYDLTNLATLKNWPLEIALIDIVWGIFLSISVSYLTFISAKAL